MIISANKLAAPAPVSASSKPTTPTPVPAWAGAKRAAVVLTPIGVMSRAEALASGLLVVGSYA